VYQLFRTNNQGRLRLVSYPNHKWYWIKDTLRDRTTTITEALNDSQTNVTLADASLFKEGDVFYITAAAGVATTEMFLVQSVNTTTNVATVATRGTSTGTTAVSHADNAAVTYLYSARLEGADNDQSRSPCRRPSTTTRRFCTAASPSAVPSSGRPPATA